jgi:hypothetical protein
MSITLNTKVYTFAGIMSGITSWAYRGLGLAALFSNATISVKLDTMSRVQAKLKVVNAADVESGCCATDPAAGFCEADIKIRMSPNATAAERTDFALRLLDFVGTTVFQSAITNLEQPSS